MAEDLLQLYQVHLWLLDRELPAPAQGLSGVLSQLQLQQCKDAWEKQTAAVNSRQQSSKYTIVQISPFYCSSNKSNRLCMASRFNQVS